MKEILERRSVRRFTEQPVEKEKIKQILRAAMAAPSAVNQRPWEFYVVTDKDTLQKLSQSSPYAGPVGGAPAAIVVCYRRDGLTAPEYADIDCAIASENIWLEITSQGLGGVMIGIAPVGERMARVAVALDLPDDLKAFTIIPFGYAADEHEQPDRYDDSRVHFI